MAFRNDLLYGISLGVFQDFDHGKVVEDWVPAEWNLQAGDRLEWEAGCNLSGIAEVAEIISRNPDEFGRVKCTFKKIS